MGHNILEFKEKVTAVKTMFYDYSYGKLVTALQEAIYMYM